MAANGTLRVRMRGVDRVMYEGAAQSLSLQSLAGQVTLLPGHCQVVGQIQPGTIALLDESSKRHQWSVQGGWFRCHDNVLQLLLIPVGE